jgi:hypothetical protein
MRSQCRRGLEHTLRLITGREVLNGLVGDATSATRAPQVVRCDCADIVPSDAQRHLPS